MKQRTVINDPVVLITDGSDAVVGAVVVDCCDVIVFVWILPELAFVSVNFVLTDAVVEGDVTVPNLRWRVVGLELVFGFLELSYRNKIPLFTLFFFWVCAAKTIKLNGKNCFPLTR